MRHRWLSIKEWIKQGAKSANPPWMQQGRCKDRVSQNPNSISVMQAFDTLFISNNVLQIERYMRHDNKRVITQDRITYLCWGPTICEYTWYASWRPTVQARTSPHAGRGSRNSRLWTSRTADRRHRLSDGRRTVAFCRQGGCALLLRS